MLSLTMIAKDEEDNLPRCLESARPWVDEIVFVDTGSTDRTMQIAGDFGARLYEHPWQGDFSLHRNQALSYARGDWCLQLDADEELVQSSAGLLPGLMQDDETNGYQVIIENVFRDPKKSSLSHVLRLFRRLPQVHYFNPVHNQLHIPGTIKTCKLAIKHYGFDGEPEDMRRKFQRRKQMVQGWIKDKPQDHMAHFYLSQAMMTNPDLVQNEGAEKKVHLPSLDIALKSAHTALNLARQNRSDPQIISRIYEMLNHGLELAKAGQAIINNLMAWQQVDPENPDIAFKLFNHFFNGGIWPQALAQAVRYLQLHDNAAAYLATHPYIELTTLEKRPRMLMGYAVAAAKCNDRVQFSNALELLFAYAENKPQAILAYQVLCQNNLPEFARVMLARAGDRGLDWLS